MLKSSLNFNSSLITNTSNDPLDDIKTPDLIKFGPQNSFFKSIMNEDLDRLLQDTFNFSQSIQPQGIPVLSDELLLTEFMSIDPVPNSDHHLANDLSPEGLLFPEDEILIGEEQPNVSQSIPIPINRVPHMFSTVTSAPNTSYTSPSPPTGQMNSLNISNQNPVIDPMDRALDQTLSFNPEIEANYHSQAIEYNTMTCARPRFASTSEIETYSGYGVDLWASSESEASIQSVQRSERTPRHQYRYGGSATDSALLAMRPTATVLPSFSRAFSPYRRRSLSIVSSKQTQTISTNANDVAFNHFNHQHLNHQHLYQNQPQMQPFVGPNCGCVSICTNQSPITRTISEPALRPFMPSPAHTFNANRLMMQSSSSTGTRAGRKLKDPTKRPSPAAQRNQLLELWGQKIDEYTEDKHNNTRRISALISEVNSLKQDCIGMTVPLYLQERHKESLLEIIEYYKQNNNHYYTTQLKYETNDNNKGNNSYQCF